MFVDYLLSNFEIFIFFSICLLVIGFFLIFCFQNLKFQNNKDAITAYADVINKNNKEIKEYLIVVGNLLEHQKKELVNLSDKISFIEREISRLGNIKGSEDMLSIAIDMAKNGNNREEIKNKTGLREDEIEAIYTYYKK
ncbi:hypothetical protein OA970_01710 [Alphaproteobacteria bacterium]|nr:hypothetical protein [Alphaproteobacteria bacterium]